MIMSSAGRPGTPDILLRAVALLALGLVCVGCQQNQSPTASPNQNPAGPPTPGITLENYDRVREGMTMAEVKAILGPPLSSVYKDGSAVWQDDRPGQSDPKPGREYVWQWFAQHKHLESLDIYVVVDGDKVKSKRESRSKIDPR